MDEQLHRDASDNEKSSEGGEAGVAPHQENHHTHVQESSQVYTAAGQGFAFNGSATPDGNGYTTPTGGHGYVYAPASSDDARGHRRKDRHRVGMILLLCGVILLLAVLVLMGGWMVLHMRNTTDTPREEVSGDGVESTFTPSGSFIVIDPSETTPAGEETVAPHTTTTGAETFSEMLTEANQIDTTGLHYPQNAMPEHAVLIKKTPLRQDADKDGKADAVLGADGQILTSAGQQATTAATVFYRVAQSVVEITTETRVQSGWTGQYVQSGAGSGVIVAKEGFIVTNHHVIDGADSVVVTLADGTRYAAVLVGTDAKTDIALLWIDPAGKELTVATLGASFDLVVGEDILAIGNPLGSLGGTMTEGMISATARSIRMEGAVMTLLQISAPINPGNSGGGLFNMAGELVGIVNAKYTNEAVEGLGFAIPIDTAYEIICQLYQYGYVPGRPSTGLTLVDASSTSTAMYYFRSPYTGVYVYDSALTEELQYGDLILSFAGTKVTSSDQITLLVEEMAVGDTLEVVVYRKGEQVTVHLTLGEAKPTTHATTEETARNAA